MFPNDNASAAPDRARLILALARARGWKIPQGAEGTTPDVVLGARWESATSWERAAFERELAAVEADPARAAALLGEPDRPGSVIIMDPAESPATQLPGALGGNRAPLPPGGGRGRYELKKEHARGGMGRVLVVLDREVGREVAMKELLPKFAEGFAWDRERFLREARITGQLEHPNIVPVYEIGAEDGGAAYYTMKLVGGETMEARLERIQKNKQLTGRQRLAERLKLLDALIDACNAVAYAHSRGVVNRDLKPANIMIGDFGETVVLDWGLARKLAEEEAPMPRGATPAPAMSPGEHASKGDTTRLTMDGDILGTPAYMAPEQARGEIDRVDERSDVYALGAMLFEILTGRSPYEGETAIDLLLAVIDRPSPSADEVEPLAPRELSAVASAAMVKDQSRRLSSAKTLAEEIKAWRDGRPMTLYKHSALEQLRRFTRHNRALATALGGAVLILAAGVAVSMTYARLASDRAASEHIARELADTRSVETRRSEEKAQAALKFAQGQRLAAYSLNLRQENTTAALLVAIESARLAPGVASTNALWSTLSELLERQRFFLHEHNVTDGNISPDGRLVATAGADFTARIWEVATGAEVHCLTGHRSGVTVVEWSADGKRLLTAPGNPYDPRIQPFQPAGCVDAAPRIWDVATGKCLRVLRGHTGVLRSAVWAPGERVLTWSDDATVRLWDAEGRAIVFTAPWPVWYARVSPDGRWVSASSDIHGCLWRTDVPAEARDLPGHTERLDSMSFSADSKFIVTTDHAGRILRRDVETLSVVNDLRLTAPDPNDPKASRVVAEGVYDATHHPDGKRVLFVASTGIHVWTSDLSREISFSPVGCGPLLAGMLDRDWKRIVVRMEANAVVRDVATGADLVWFRGHEYNLEFAHFSPDGRRVVTGGRDHTAIVWDAEPGACLPTFRWHTTQQRPYLSADGTVAIVRGPDGRLEVHDNRTGELTLALDFPGEQYDVRFLGNGRRFAAWTQGSNCFRIGDAARGWLFDADCGGKRARWIRASPNSEWILAVSDEGDARFWSVATGKGGPAFKAPRTSYDYSAVSDDGRTFAMVDASTACVALYDSSDAHETAKLVGHSGWTIGCAFPSDGEVLTTAMDATVRCWDRRTGAFLRSGRWPLIQETFIFPSPAGHAFALDGGGTARFYRLDTLDQVAALPRTFSTPVGFSLDGRFAVARRAGAVVHLPMDALAFAESVVPRELTPLEQRGMTDSRAEADAYSQEYYKRRPRPGSMVARAERALGDKKWEEALRQIGDAIPLLPGHPGAYELAARAHAMHAALLPESDPDRATAIEEGVKALEAAEERGYRDVETLEKDDGLATLRRHPRWAALVANAKKDPW
ncbi:MAG: protein kinase [Planctomycetes bacterium]|nr:protein kinase [Planctomycetota bacterium]